MSAISQVSTMTPFILAYNGKANNKVEAEHNDWDLVTFLRNGTNWGSIAGGAFMGLVGLFCVITGGFKIAKQLMNPAQNQQESWVMHIGLLIFGGALLFGGMSLLLSFAKGGKDTVEGFGSGKQVR